jgi:hypothetical protein
MSIPFASGASCSSLSLILFQEDYRAMKEMFQVCDETRYSIREAVKRSLPLHLAPQVS